MEDIWLAESRESRENAASGRRKCWKIHTSQFKKSITNYSERCTFMKNPCRVSCDRSSGFDVASDWKLHTFGVQLHRTSSIHQGHFNIICTAHKYQCKIKLAICTNETPLIESSDLNSNTSPFQRYPHHVGAVYLCDWDIASLAVAIKLKDVTQFPSSS